ncbi:glycosyltransferase [Psychroserpens ponticola]|uniref:Glycosyltransferase n=1 Tax=Psychroserpens ponticola TaxID=2932268 RepID=A0ABY7RVJ9_9FLAO|nr:glycosyltransferase [Psychroserpens ponticola]WCO01132.1 glycosyltransferase [Psychroserpens ponticola]
MKIIHYIGSLGFGGIERLVYDLVSQQIKREVMNVAIGVGNIKGEFKTQFENLGVSLIDFNLNSGFDLNPSKILKISKSFKHYDVIHLHGFHLSIALAAILSGKKIIYTEHGNFGFGRQIKSSDKLSFFLRKLFFKIGTVYICCNSTFTKGLVEKRFYKGNRLQIVYNGSSIDKVINLQLLERLQKKYSANFIVGVVGRLAGVKRVDKVIEVFNSYLKINKSAKLLIIGEGVEKENLLKKVKNLNILDNVEFLGYQDEIMTYQSLFNVNVIGSKNEAFGLVTVESYSVETPILAFSDGGGVVEIINRFNPEDICLDEKAMIERLKHYQVNEFIPGDDSKHQLEFFSLERMEQDYYNQYKKVI